MECLTVFVWIFVPAPVKQLLLEVLIVPGNVENKLFVAQAVLFSELAYIGGLLNPDRLQEYFIRYGAQFLVENIEGFALEEFF